MPLDPHREAVVVVAGSARCQPKTENTGRHHPALSAGRTLSEGLGAWQDRLQSSAEIAVAPAAARHFDDRPVRCLRHMAH
jgi:hypothetical protein